MGKDNKGQRKLPTHTENNVKGVNIEITVKRKLRMF